MLVRLWAAVLCVLWIAPIGISQDKVDPRNMYHRVLCVVPMVGSGTLEDPKRPMYAPAPGAMNPANRKGTLAFHFEPSDDGKNAVVEFVATDASLLQDVLSDSKVKSFQKDRDKKDDIEKELKKYKKDFKLERFGLVVLP